MHRGSSVGAVVQGELDAYGHHRRVLWVYHFSPLLQRLDAPQRLRAGARAATRA